MNPSVYLPAIPQFAEKIHNGRQIQPAFAGLKISDITHPYLVWARRVKVLVQQIWRHFRSILGGCHLISPALWQLRLSSCISFLTRQRLIWMPSSRSFLTSVQLPALPRLTANSARSLTLTAISPDASSVVFLHHAYQAEALTRITRQSVRTLKSMALSQMNRYLTTYASRRRHSLRYGFRFAPDKFTP